MRSEGQRWLAVGPADAYVLLWVRVEGDALRRVVTLRTSHRLVNTLDIPLVVELGEGAAAGGAAPSGCRLAARRRSFSDSRATRRAHTLRVRSADGGVLSSPLPVPLPPLDAGARGAAGDALGEVRQHHSGRRVLVLAHTAAGGGSTELIFAPPLRLINGATAPIATDEAGSEGRRRRWSRRWRGAGRRAAASPPRRPAALWRPAAHAWCEPPLLLDAAALQRAAESPLAGAHGAAATRPAAAAPRTERRRRRRRRVRRADRAVRGAQLQLASTARAELRLRAHTIALPPPTPRAPASRWQLGGQRAEPPEVPAALRRSSARRRAGGVVRLAACRPPSAARVAARRRRNRLAQLRRRGALPAVPTGTRAARRLQHERTAAPRRRVRPFFTPSASGSAPVSVGRRRARAAADARQVCAADDAADDDDDAWGWSGELDVGEAAAGKRQRAVLQSERGRLLLVSAEVSADGFGAFCDTFFDDPQPPIVLRNHTAADIYFAPELDDEGEEEGEEEWLRLAAGATAHFALPDDDDALLPGAEAAAAGEGEAAAIRVALRADGGGGGGGSFRLAPPRLLKLSALSALVAQEGPTTTVHLLPPVALCRRRARRRWRRRRPRGELPAARAQLGGARPRLRGGDGGRPAAARGTTGVEAGRCGREGARCSVAAAGGGGGRDDGVARAQFARLADRHAPRYAFRTVISADAPPASVYVARVLGPARRAHPRRARGAAAPPDRRRAPADADARVRSAAPR